MEANYLQNDAKIAARWASDAIASIKTCILIDPYIENELKEIGLGNFDIVITHYNIVVLFKRWADISELSFRIALNPRAKVEEIMDNTVNFYVDESGIERHIPIFYANQFVDGGIFILPGGVDTPDGPMKRMFPGCAIFMRVGAISQTAEEFVVSTTKQLKISKNIKSGSGKKFQCGAGDPLQTFNKIVQEFKIILDRVDDEETIQKFLHDNPILIYPEYAKMWPKMKLGAEFITDFVFENFAHVGTQHVFVEIESVRHPLFTKNGKLSSQYSHAKNQILDWKVWIETNRAYLEQSIPTLGTPAFHLVMGRSIDDPKLRRKILSDALPLMYFSTYDDLIKRAEQLVSRILQKPQYAGLLDVQRCCHDF